MLPGRQVTDYLYKMQTSTLWPVFDDIVVASGIHTIIEYEAPSANSTVMLEKLSIPGGVFRFKSGTLLVNTIGLSTNIEMAEEETEIVVQVRILFLVSAWF